MRDSRDRFQDRVANYVKYRPGYPAEAFETVVAECGLDAGSVVCDVGCGTGISSKPLLERGLSVIGVEPNGPMREAAVEYLQDFKSFRAESGEAGATGLPDKGVDLVFCAQAFHWFADAKTAAEFRRILRPKGRIALIWNERVTESDVFHSKYEELIRQFGTDYSDVRHDRLGLSEIESVFETGFEVWSFSNSQEFDFEGLLGRLMSSSYMPSEDSDDFPRLREMLRLLFAEHEELGKIAVSYKTNLYISEQ